MAKKKKKRNISKTNIWVVVGIIFLWTILLVVSYLRWGIVGIILDNLLRYLFGIYYLAVMIVALLYYAYYAAFKKYHELPSSFLAGLFLIALAILTYEGLYQEGVESFKELGRYITSCFMHLLDHEIYAYKAGIFGFFIYVLLKTLFEKTFVTIFTYLLFIAGIALMIPFSFYSSVGNKAKENYKRTKEKQHIEKATRKASFIDIADKNEIVTKQIFDVKPKKEIKQVRETIDIKENTNETKEVMADNVYLKDGSYKLPPLSLLNDAPQRKGNINRNSAEVKGKKIIEILDSFNIPAELINIYIGPSLTKFEIKPDHTIKVSSILSIKNDIMMGLAAKDIYIEAPIPGRSAVGIEIPNGEPTTVYLKDMFGGINQINNPLLFVLGKDFMGRDVNCELNKMPHLLIAGATGSGKSVCINTIIMSLIMRNHPDDVKLVLVDPKKVEFTPYHDIPHLLWPVITDATLAAQLLDRIVGIMEERYDVFASCGVRKIDDYNRFVAEHNRTYKEENKLNKMPYIVVIIDELADMMAVAGKEVNFAIQRITQLARACGIHLIVATQRPSTDVITGVIKANIPSRIAFAVASNIDSRTIIDRVGAERLLGNGDMLYAPQGERAPIRLQGVYVRDDEIKRVTEFLKKQATPAYDDAYFSLKNQPKGDGIAKEENDDPLFPQIIEYIKESQKASTSLFQRRFGIGYNRASRIIDSLEEMGYIGPNNGSKAREVYLKKEGKEEDE